MNEVCFSFMLNTPQAGYRVFWNMTKLCAGEYCNGILRDLWTQFRVKETTQEPNNTMF